MSWTDDGAILYSEGDQILQVSANGGEPERVAAVEAGYAAIDPQRLPAHGLGALFPPAREWDDLGTRTAATRIVVASRSSGEVRTIRTGGTSGRYLPTGHLLYTANAVVYAVPFDVRTLQVTGAACAGGRWCRGVSRSA